MTRQRHALIPAFCIAVALSTCAFGQVREYTESFDRDRQDDPTVVESLQHLKTSHSRLDTEELLKKLNEWGQPHHATFRTERDVILMKYPWVHEGVQSQPHGWREVQGTIRCFNVADIVMNEWNKDRRFQLVRFAGVELKALNQDRTETRTRSDQSRTWKLVAYPEVIILLE